MGFYPPPRGTRYYVFSVVWTYNPSPIATELTQLRFQFNKLGDDISRFHAFQDGPSRRPYVYNVLRSYRDWNFNAILVEKRKVNPTIRDPLIFYPKFASIPLAYVLKYQLAWGTSQVMIYTDRIPVSKHNKAIKKAIQTACAAALGHTRPFQIFHHPGESNCWLQVADYCSWVVAKKWENNNPADFNILQGQYRGKELDVLSRGVTLYY